MNNKFTSMKFMTDWETLNFMTDEDIYFSNCPEITPEMAKNATVRLGLKSYSKKQALTLYLDDEIVTWYKSKELKKILLKAGFTYRQGKGSHTFWTHPLIRDEPITISGKDGDDAKLYLVQLESISADVRNPYDFSTLGMITHCSPIFSQF